MALGDIKVPLRGKLLKDDDETVRMRIGEGWDVDIYKAMIVNVRAKIKSERERWVAWEREMRNRIMTLTDIGELEELVLAIERTEGFDV